MTKVHLTHLGGIERVKRFPMRKPNRKQMQDLLVCFSEGGGGICEKSVIGGRHLHMFEETIEVKLLRGYVII